MTGLLKTWTLFIKSLGLGKVVLAGLSMGGWNAMLYAAANPGAVERIVIVDIAPERSDEALRDQVTRPPTPMAFYNFEEAFAWAREGNPWATETRFRKDVANKMRQESTGMWVWRADPALFNNTLPDNQEPEYIARYWRSLEAIQCPIMEVRGKESILVSDDIVERMKKANPRFSCVDVEDSGHVVTVDKPQGFIDATKEFLRDLKIETTQGPLTIFGQKHRIGLLGLNTSQGGYCDRLVKGRC